MKRNIRLRLLRAAFCAGMFAICAVLLFMGQLIQDIGVLYTRMQEVLGTWVANILVAHLGNVTMPLAAGFAEGFFASLKHDDEKRVVEIISRGSVLMGMLYSIPEVITFFVIKADYVTCAFPRCKGDLGDMLCYCVPLIALVVRIVLYGS
jgi:hypothetical protein